MCWVLLFHLSKVTSQDHPAKRTSADMELRNYPKPNIYLHNYQTEKAIFLATKHKKTIVTCSYYIQIFPYRKYIKTAKMVPFVRKCLVKMTLRLF